jgi:hypothetical protein
MSRKSDNKVSGVDSVDNPRNAVIVEALLQIAK